MLLVLRWLDRKFWMNRRCSGRQLIRVRKPVTHEVPRRSIKSAQMTRLLAPPSRRQAPVESESLAEIFNPTSMAKVASCLKAVEEVAGELVGSRPARWRRAGQRNQRRKRATTSAEVCAGGVWATTPPFAHAGRSFDVSRWKVGRIAPGTKSCEDTRSTT